MSNSKRPQSPGGSERKRTPRGQQVIIAVIALVCVGAVIALGAFRSGGDDPDPESASTPGPTQSADPSADAQPSALDCSKPPPKPAKPQQFSKVPPKSLAEGSRWDATVTTNCGDITLELYGDKAPQTVASFIFLAKHGYWDDSPCHRLTTPQQGLSVLQCGDPTGSGSGNPGYGYGIENAPADGSYPTGTLAMARAPGEPNSNGGQFFVVYGDTKLPTKGGGYSIFGKITGGMDIVQAIAAKGLASNGTAPKQPISIMQVAVQKQ
ncbi:MAG: peptidylprolyl isomerase [Nocardioidaceae bacterium]